MHLTTAKRVTQEMEDSADHNYPQVIDTPDYFIWTDGRNWKTATGNSDPRKSSIKAAQKILEKYENEPKSV